MRTSWLAMLPLTLCACSYDYTSDVKARAAVELSCAEPISVTALGDYTYCASGCDESAVFVCFRDDSGTDVCLREDGPCPAPPSS